MKICSHLPQPVRIAAAFWFESSNFSMSPVQLQSFGSEGIRFHQVGPQARACDQGILRLEVDKRLTQKREFHEKSHSTHHLELGSLSSVSNRSTGSD